MIDTPWIKTAHRFPFRKCLPFLAILLPLSILNGCGGGGEEGPPRFHVSGKVTFDGKPVPAGTIIFEPDSSQGNKGPQGTARIENGNYDTASGGKGTVGGPHIVRIQGADGQSSEGLPLGNPLFNNYQTEAELPKKESTQDFEVPASAAENLPDSDVPPP